MNKEAVLLDFDNTLTKTDTVKFILCSFFVSNPLFAVKIIKQYGVRAKDPDIIKYKIFTSFIKNKSVHVVSSALRFYRFMTRISLRKSIVTRIKNVEQMIIIASASPSFALRTLELFPGVQIIATEYEVCNGYYTGNLSSPICYGEEKYKRVKEFLVSEKVESIAEAYTDHHSDFPILSLAHKKYLVCPDSSTRLQATPEMKIVE